MNTFVLVDDKGAMRDAICFLVEKPVAEILFKGVWLSSGTKVLGVVT